MKRLLQVGLLGLLAALAISSAGCKTRPKNVTALPGSEARAGGTDLPTGKPLPSGGNGGNTGTGFAGTSPNTRPYVPPSTGPGVDLPPDTTGIDKPIGTTQLPAGGFGEGRLEDRETLKGNVVYFEYDKSAVKKSEQIKVAAVAEYLKSHPDALLTVEGHCDERGTEGYNLALGERRALAVREALLNLGVPAASVSTVSFGEARPADPAQSDSAYAKNRRAEFVLLPANAAAVR
jgi:peptidoglycan-associated lipoprotein